MKKKRLLICTLVVLLLVNTLPILASASGNEISDININILLDDDGTAHITEVWTAQLNAGTEVYLVKDNLNQMEIVDFKVSDESGAVYQNIGIWNVDASFDQKAYKCGINENGSAKELCFGMSSYGAHQYTIQYTMTNFVNRYADEKNGFNVRVVNDQLSAEPEHVKISLEKKGQEFTTEDTQIWAFGYGGTIYIEEGKIVAETTQRLTSDQHMTILAGFDVALFNPSALSSDSFETVKTAAFVGSDYEQNPNSDGTASTNEGGTGYEENDTEYNGFYFPAPLFGLAAIFLVLVFLGGTKAGRARRKGGSVDLGLHGGKIDQSPSDYSREIPFEGDLLATNYILDSYGGSEDGGLIGATFLRWSRKGVVQIDEELTRGFFGLTEKTQAIIKFLPLKEELPIWEQELYNMVLEAAGNDGVLQEKEFFKWSRGNYTEVDDLLERAKDIGGQRLQSMAAAEYIDTTVFFGLIKTKKFTLNEKGMTLSNAMYGFKKYLKDFTIINERAPKEVELWDDYLVFATLFGIADQVAKEFQNLYPDFFADSYGGNSYGSYIYTMSMINAMSRAAVSGAADGRSAAQSRSSGGGGSASFGGGGGFSGGGSGGGFR